MQLSGTGSRDKGGTDARCGGGKPAHELVGEAGLRGCDQECAAERSSDCARGAQLAHG